MQGQWKAITIEYLRNKKDGRFFKSVEDSWAQFSIHEKYELFRFLYNAGHWRFLAELFAKEMTSSDASLPWAFLLAVFSHKKIPVPESQQTSLRRQLKKVKIKVQDISDYRELLDALKLKIKYNHLAEVQARKQELLSSAQIAQSEQLYDQQLSYLRELNKLFPKDSHVREDLRSRQVSDAEKVLSRAKRQTRHFSKKESLEVKEEEPIVDRLKSQARNIVAKNQQARLDIAMMFRQMGYSRDALEFIDQENMDHRTAWLMFDFLFQAKQYLALLHHCELMKLEFAGHPMALFSISYMEALTYWELGERDRAIELMRHIAQMKPDFRSANELLYSWQEESG